MTGCQNENTINLSQFNPIKLKRKKSAGASPYHKKSRKTKDK